MGNDAPSVRGALWQILRPMPRDVNRPATLHGGESYLGSRGCSAGGYVRDIVRVGGVTLACATLLAVNAGCGLLSSGHHASTRTSTRSPVLVEVESRNW